MRIYLATFVLSTLLASSVSYAAQQPAAAAPSTPAPATPAPAASAQARSTASSTPAATLSQILKPSLDGLGQAIDALKLEKWKGSSIRSEADTNVSSIQRDLQSTLPPLLATADAAPSTVSKLFPVQRNIDALYDVLLRVVDAAQFAAPSDQFTQLQQAMTTLGSARLTLGERIQEAALLQEKQVFTLQTTLKAQATPSCPVVPAPVTPSCPAPAKKVVRKKKPATTTTPATGTPATTTPPAAAPKQ